VAHAVFEQTRVLGTVFVHQLDLAVLEAVAPLPNLDVARGVGEHPVPVLLAVADVPLVLGPVFVHHFALAAGFDLPLVVVLEGLHPRGSLVVERACFGGFRGCRVESVESHFVVPLPSNVLVVVFGVVRQIHLLVPFQLLKQFLVQFKKCVVVGH